MKRRNFILKSGAAMSIPFIPGFNLVSKTYDNPEKLLYDKLPVNFKRDGLDLSPELYTLLLQQLIKNKDFKPDSYGHNGMTESFEKKAAQVLGKEAAVYMPSGTLANHLAIRNHCLTKKRAVVQYESHINRDSGDCVSNLSGINLLTLGKNKIFFDAKNFINIIEDSNKGKVKTDIGVISLETPVRRKHLQRIPFNKIKEIIEIAKKNNIATHLDGARLFIDSAFSGKKVKEYTSMFDTVYLSLYKSFNTIGGAILAGTYEFIKDLHHQRRMFGGTLPSSWEQIAIADYFFDNYEERYNKTLRYFQILKNKLTESGKFTVSEFQYGSNIIKLKINQKTDFVNFKDNLAKSEIFIPDWNKSDKCFYLKINDSLVYNNINTVAETFINAL